MKPFVRPFRHGDVVKFTKNFVTGWAGKQGEVYSSWKLGEEHIIYETVREGNSWEYSTNQGAWIPHESFTFVRECDEASIKKLYSDLREEYTDV